MNASARTVLLADTGEIGRFVEALFCYASEGSRVALRAFYDDRADRPFAVEDVTLNGAGLAPVAAVAAWLATRAAAEPRPVVFCPPIATFGPGRGATADDLAEGLALSVELDEAPAAARATLEQVLGSATVVVASGGEWADPETGKIEWKLHLHWRLTEPTRGPGEHTRLKQARALATALAGGDRSNISIVHPIRWPGSWHRKGTPRLARILALNERAEVELDEALGLLQGAVAAQELTDEEPEAVCSISGARRADRGGDERPGDGEFLEALRHLPATLSYDDWLRALMGIHDFYGGSRAGLEVAKAWSSTYPDYKPHEVEAKWRSFAVGRGVGYRSVLHLAKQHGANLAAIGGLRDRPARGVDFTHLKAPGGTALPHHGLADFFAHRPSHRFIFAPTGDEWPAASVNAHVGPIPGPDGKPISASAWLDEHRAVEQRTWAPGEPLEIGDRLITDGGWRDRLGCRVFNEYRPPTVSRHRGGDATRWLDHIRRVYPAEADHLVRWLASRVQRPEVKINHALLLGGEQGVGKDTILEPVKQAVGPWNFNEVSPRQMLGRFNGFLKSVIIRVSEARDLGDVDRFAFYDHMKTYTAAPPDVLRVDQKFINEFSILNCCGVIITSNHKADGIFLPPDDRRHFVAWSPLSAKDFASGYWSELYGWFGSGGNEAVAAHLHELDLSDFDPKAPPPKTAAFWDIVNAGQAPETSEMADALDLCGRPAAVTLATIRDRCTDFAFRDWLNDRRNARKIPHRMEECGYQPVRNAGPVDALWRVAGKRQVIYAQRKLALSERMRAATALADGRR